MLQTFNSYISSHKLINPGQSVLIGLSGGIDSMVLLSLFMKTEYRIGVAHINHNLRGIDSEQDALFVEAYCKSNDIPFHVLSLDIHNLAKEAQMNMQEYARIRRYDFMNSISSTYNYDKIATAHHSDDQIEGFMLNLIRGSGLKGLKGMSSSRVNIIRPLLCVNKKDIIQYGEMNKIPFRVDQSNASLKYRRNNIRHKLIPNFLEINPTSQKTILRSIHQLNDSYNLLQHLIAKEQKEITKIEKDQLIIDLIKVTLIPGHITLLHEILNTYGFTTSQIEDIVFSKTRTGAKFITSSHKAIINRGDLIVKPLIPEQEKTYTLLVGEKLKIPNLGLIQIEEIESKIISSDNNIAILDKDKLEFPLSIRKWLPGDKFQPYGMKGHTKKIKKYLTDIKLNQFEKENTYVLLSGEDICWLIGYRVDKRFIGKDIQIKLS